MAPISTPSHGRRFGMHARALLSVSKTIQTPPPVGGYPRGCTFPPKAKPSSYLPTTLGLCVLEAGDGARQHRPVIRPHALRQLARDGARGSLVAGARTHLEPRP